MVLALAQLQASLGDRYQLEDELGSGGQGAVYRAHDRRLHRTVAVKFLRPDIAPLLGSDRFQREIAIAASLSHPNIVPLLDSGGEGPRLFYTMPLVEGESLRARLGRQSQLPLEDAFRIVRDVAAALDYAHERGYVHRDIKPENILLAGERAIVLDFGIARAIEVAGDSSITSGNVVIGTPLYMSPEQGSGQKQLDGRTDIYSLACVLYEMLAGTPPFTGGTPQAVLARHLFDPPPRLSVVRGTVSPALEEAIGKALSKVPADRFATAAEFAAALPRHGTPQTGEAAIKPRRTVRRSPHVSRAGWALIGALTLAGALTATAFHRRATPTLDASLYMVLPFRHRAEAVPMLLNGDQCESLLHDALGRWRGVQMVDPLWVADARAQRGGATSIKDGVAIARERRAGRVVLGEVWQFKDTIYVRGLLYDAGGQRLVREQSIRIAPDLSDVQARFQELADSLLIGGGLGAGPPPRGSGRLSLPAWHAFQDGYAALQRWDLDSAKVKLQQALAIDPTYATAQFWLAQVLAWAGDKPASWKRYAAGALASPDSLAPRDRGVAEGMLALAEGRFPQACERFRALIAQDSLDFAAWFGLGDCQGKDPLVVHDSTSSGWRFRGSYHAAVNAYRHALEIVPSVHLAFRGQAFDRLPQLLYTEPNHIRRGYALTPDTVRFGAFPTMTRDTLEFVPRPLTEVVAAEPGAIPATVGAAVSRNRELMREIATTWVRAFPTRADAHETLGLVLETLGELTAGRSKEYSAVSEIRRARATAREPVQALRLANMEIRFLVKSEQMASARALADSVLRANPNPTLDGARQLRGLAALTGRIHLAARLQRRAAPDYTFLTPDWEEVNVPLQLTDAALGLFAYSAFGRPLDSLVALEQRVERLIPSYVEAGKRSPARQAMLDIPAVLAFPERGVRPMHRAKAGGNYLLEMQWELARGDTAALRKHFAKIRAVQRDIRPGDVTFDGTYHEAWLLLAVGDTVEATRLLDLSLEALPTLSTSLIDQLPEVATLVRGMALRAELAGRAGDSTAAKRWAKSVVLLWSGADRELQPTVQSMGEIVGGRVK